MKRQTLLLSALLISLCAQSRSEQAGNKAIVDFFNVKDSGVIVKTSDETNTILPYAVGIAARFNLKPVDVEKNVSVKAGKGDLPIFISMGLLNLVFMRMETDKYGNWTRRKDNDGRVSIQTITYYE